MLWGSTSGRAALSIMPTVPLDGTSRGGWLLAVFPDDSHILVDANEVIVSLEESGV